MTLDTRENLIYCAKVYLAQSRHFTKLARPFSFALLDWAANCRRRAGQLKKQLELKWNNN